MLGVTYSDADLDLLKKKYLANIFFILNIYKLLNLYHNFLLQKNYKTCFYLNYSLKIYLFDFDLNTNRFDPDHQITT